MAKNYVIMGLRHLGNCIQVMINKSIILVFDLLCGVFETERDKLIKLGFTFNNKLSGLVGFGLGFNKASSFESSPKTFSSILELSPDTDSSREFTIFTVSETLE